ncbi:MAG: tripartite tricarboxylate transporter TctB family protein [Helicobacter sp.]|nr:tripartite tricarboxylate transporter TctB family protein [Helicobacter sp.]
MLYNGLSISTTYSYEPLGPKPFPIASLSLIALCSIALFFFAEDTKVNWGNLTLWKKLVILSIALFIFAGIFEYLGFIIASIFLSFTMALLFGAKKLYAIIFAIIISFLLYYLFDRLLQITLPIGYVFTLEG